MVVLISFVCFSLQALEPPKEEAMASAISLLYEVIIHSVMKFLRNYQFLLRPNRAPDSMGLVSRSRSSFLDTWLYKRSLGQKS